MVVLAPRTLIRFGLKAYRPVFSPTVKIFLNLPEILAEVDRVARRLGRPTAFYLGNGAAGVAIDGVDELIHRSLGWHAPVSLPEPGPVPPHPPIP